MAAKGNYIEVAGDVYSYDTCIKTRMPDGKTIGNVTKYSKTTTKHQNMAGVHSCDIKLDGISRNTSASDLIRIANQQL